MHCRGLILRFDDITPAMAWDKFLPIKTRLGQLGVRCILGVVPECRDDALNIAEPRTDFFDLVRGWALSGDSIAQHGTFHVYDSSAGGLLGINARSEFAGHSFEKQLERLARGKAVLEREGVWQPYFMAPSHSFDLNTLRALRSLGFLAVTDGVGFHPYLVEDLLFVPQLTSRALPVTIGVQTICIHINSMTQPQLERLLEFVERRASAFCDFKAVVRNGESNSLWAGMLRSGSALAVRCARRARAHALS